MLCKYPDSFQQIHAILTRDSLIGGDNRKTVKGRDYFDLLWFLKKSVKPNLKRLSEMLGKDMKMPQLRKQLDTEVDILVNRYMNDFKSDLTPLISETDFINVYIDNYYEEYCRFSELVFS